MVIDYSKWDNIDTDSDSDDEKDKPLEINRCENVQKDQVQTTTTQKLIDYARQQNKTLINVTDNLVNYMKTRNSNIMGLNSVLLQHHEKYKDESNTYLVVEWYLLRQILTKKKRKFI
eukprot:UN05102